MLNLAVPWYLRVFCIFSSVSKVVLGTFLKFSVLVTETRSPCFLRYDTALEPAAPAEGGAGVCGAGGAMLSALAVAAVTESARARSYFLS